MRNWIYEYLDEDQRSWAEKNISLVEASIGRMVPVMTQEQKKEDPLLICEEPYAKLPVDSSGFRGEIPDLLGLVPFSPFGYYIKRKLFMHNMGHAICGYLGAEKGYAYIWPAADDLDIKQIARKAMLSSTESLVNEYGSQYWTSLHDHIEDLLFRFRNKELGDTIARVCGDPVRKLRRNDRLVGAALYCMEQGISPEPIFIGIRAALTFKNAEDVSANQLQAVLNKYGTEKLLNTYMGLTRQDKLFGLLLSYLNESGI
jgi:Mannitol-1-phosphate/altronate dehydrogenases